MAVCEDCPVLANFTELESRITDPDTKQVFDATKKYFLEVLNMGDCRGRSTFPNDGYIDCENRSLGYLLGLMDSDRYADLNKRAEQNAWENLLPDFATIYMRQIESPDSAA